MSWQQDRGARGPAALEVAVGLGGVGQRGALVDADLDRAAGDPQGSINVCKSLGFSTKRVSLRLFFFNQYSLAASSKARLYWLKNRDLARY
jgi:hypothetical protein